MTLEMVTVDSWGPELSTEILESNRPCHFANVTILRNIGYSLDKRKVYFRTEWS